MEETATATVTCATEDCENRGMPITVPVDTTEDGPVQLIQCGPCGATLRPRA